jgi:hypothetical protein
MNSTADARLTWMHRKDTQGGYILASQPDKSILNRISRKSAAVLKGAHSFIFKKTIHASKKLFRKLRFSAR